MLTRRNGIYYYRRAVPERLRGVIGKREFIVSLKTRDSAQALLKAHQIDVQCNDLITKASAVSNNKNPFGLTNFETEIRVEQKPDGSKITTSTRKIDPDVIRAMTEAGISPDQIALTMREFLESTGQLPPADTQTAANLQQMRDNVTLSDYVKRYIADWERMEGHELDSRKKTQLRRLCEISPDDKSVGGFTQEDAVTVRNALAELPKYTTKYAGMPIQNIVAAAASVDSDYVRVTPTTIERYFETYQALFNQAGDDGIFVGKNPFKGVKIVPGGKSGLRQERRRRKSASKTPYSGDDLSKIFSTDFFVNFGVASEHENVNFWLPLIGLFTGSRMSQIASLYCGDITELDGIPIIDFNDSTPDKSGKTDVSFRPVPIHPLLIELGIFEFADRVRSYAIPSDFGGGSRLFPELRSFNNDTYAGRIDEWFNRQYLVSLGVRTTGDNKSFHAFRSTLLGLLKRASADEHIRNNIIGWTVNDDNANRVVRDHYDKVTLQEMLDALSSIELPPVFDKIPPFPVHRDMNFGRRYRNQWKKK